jgi:hypothetical protein
MLEIMIDSYAIVCDKLSLIAYDIIVLIIQSGAELLLQSMVYFLASSYDRDIYGILISFDSMGIMFGQLCYLSSWGLHN